MEAVTLVSKALSRLEVGEVAVVGFGGAGSTKALHPLKCPFTDADGPRVLSQLHFDQASLDCGHNNVKTENIFLTMLVF